VAFLDSSPDENTGRRIFFDTIRGTDGDTYWDVFYPMDHLVEMIHLSNRHWMELNWNPQKKPTGDTYGNYRLVIRKSSIVTVESGDHAIINTVGDHCFPVQENRFEIIDRLNGTIA
jgi:hypothetical protein